MHAQPPTVGYQPPRRKLYGLPLIIPGAVVAAIGLWFMMSVSQQYGLCSSSLGMLAQGVNATARTNCHDDAIAHNVGLVFIIAGLALAAWGILRMFWNRQQPMVPPWSA